MSIYYKYAPDGTNIGSKECLYGGTHKDMYDAVILEKGYMLLAFRSYDDATREDVKTPLGKNSLIIFLIIYLSRYTFIE